MWALDNQTRFRAERAFVRDRDGAEIWLVAVRATFSLGPNGAIALADVQDDVTMAPSYLGEPGQSSLHYDADLVRTKAGTDVVLHAHAHAPGGRPAAAVDVACTVGPMTKQLRVVGDRIWERRGGAVVPSAPQPFASLPICYERAWGGVLADGDDRRDPFNPVGVGAATAPGGAVPNVEYATQPVVAADHRGPPAGFGPIPADWQPRLALAGTYDDAWRRERQPLVPRDFQDAHFRCAPADQQLPGYLRGGEEVVLHNVTPDGTLRFRLPRVFLGFRTRIDGGTAYHTGQLHTVIIEPEARRLVMVWHSALPCHHTLYTLEETVVSEKAIVAIPTRPAAAGTAP